MTGKHFAKQTGGSTPSSATTEASQESTKVAINAANAAKDAAAAAKAANDAAAAAKAANDAAAAAKEAVVAAYNAAGGIMKLRPTETMHVPATSNVVSGNLKRPYFDYTEVVPKVFNEHQYHLCQLSDEASECWPPLTVDVDCKKLFQQYYDQMTTFKSASPVPKAIPEQEKQQYLLHGFSKLVEAYYNENFVGDGATHATWDQKLIDNTTRHGELRTTHQYATYGVQVLGVYNALDCHSVQGLHGAIFGSLSPWLEGVLLAFGASRTTTIEYTRIISTAAKVETMTTGEWATRWLNNTLQQPDFAFSYSSLEHDGLGRFGDPLNPWADLETMQRISCYVKPGGLLFLGLPVASIDILIFNAHRVYGPVRFPLVTANWEILGVYAHPDDMKSCGRGCKGYWEHMKGYGGYEDGSYQVLVVLKNSRPPACISS